MRTFRLAHPAYTEPFELVVNGAFGNGMHESTWSCLEAIPKLAPECKVGRFLDVGCGTGILSLAAIRCGFRQIVACDISRAALEAAKQNLHAARRTTAKTIEVGLVEGSLESMKGGVGGFDCIAANIQGDITLALVECIARLAAPQCHVLAAGLAWEYLFDVRKSFERLGFTQKTVQFQEEFATMILHRNEV